MRLKNPDLIVAVVIAALNVIWTLLPSQFPVIGIVLALPLVFVLPGYTLTEALFRERSLGVPDRLIFSLGLSLAIDILGGLTLNILPGGLQARSWAVLLGLLTAAFSLLAAFRRRRASVNGMRPLRLRFTLYEGVFVGLATMVIALSIVYDISSVVQQPYPGFTQLWMLPQVQAGKSCAVRLGVRSFESTSVSYRIIILMNGAEVTSWPSVVLAPQGEWDRLVPLTLRTADKGIVEAQLYRLDKPQAVYRKVDATLDNCPISQVTPTFYPGLASAYNGTIHDIPANITTNMSLTGLQQSGGNITGYFAEATGQQGTCPFRGAVTTTNIFSLQ